MSVTPYQSMQQRVFSFLSPEERQTLCLVDKGWAMANQTYLIQQCYEILKQRILNQQSVFMKNGPSVHSEKMNNVLGMGGSKMAIQLKNGQALIVPNLGIWRVMCDRNQEKLIDMEANLYPVTASWPRFVHEETCMSNLLTKIGLLNPYSKRVSLFLSEGANAPTIPAYLSESFESLSQSKGCFIIDVKNTSSSTLYNFITSSLALVSHEIV